MKEKETTILRWQEAMGFLALHDDLVTNQLLNNGVFVVLREMREGQPPVADFDLCFFVDTLANVCLNQEFLLATLQGNASAYREEEEKINKSRKLTARYRSKLSYDVANREDMSFLAGAIGPLKNSGYFHKPIGGRTAKLLRFQPAMEFLQTVSQADETSSWLLHYATYQVLENFLLHSDALEGDFDLLFFMQVMKQFLENRQLLIEVLQGKDFRWFSDEEEEREEVFCVV